MVALEIVPSLVWLLDPAGFVAAAGGRILLAPRAARTR